MVGNVTVQQSGGGCNVTSCNYSGFVNGSIASTYAFKLIFGWFVFDVEMTN